MLDIGSVAPLVQRYRSAVVGVLAEKLARRGRTTSPSGSLTQKRDRPIESYGENAIILAKRLIGESILEIGSEAANSGGDLICENDRPLCATRFNTLLHNERLLCSGDVMDIAARSVWLAGLGRWQH